MVLTVPKGPPAEMLEQRRPELEQALAAHFGRPVPVRLAIDAARRRPPWPSRSRTTSRSTSTSWRMLPPAASGVERLAEAFPGAELVDE